MQCSTPGGHKFFAGVLVFPCMAGGPFQLGMCALGFSLYGWRSVSVGHVRAEPHVAWAGVRSDAWTASRALIGRVMKPIEATQPRAIAS